MKCLGPLCFGTPPPPPPAADLTLVAVLGALEVLFAAVIVALGVWSYQRSHKKSALQFRVNELEGRVRRLTAVATNKIQREPKIRGIHTP